MTHVCKDVNFIAVLTVNHFEKQCHKSFKSNYAMEIIIYRCEMQSFPGKTNKSEICFKADKNCFSEMLPKYYNCG